MRGERRGNALKTLQKFKPHSELHNPQTHSTENCHFFTTTPIFREGKKSETAVFERVISEMEVKKEERFVDDDGTLYVWNADVQKYEPQKAKYDVEAMTFQGEEETIPSMEDALKKEEACKVGAQNRFRRHAIVRTK